MYEGRPDGWREEDLDADVAIQIRAFCDNLLSLPNDQFLEIATLVGCSGPVLRKSLDSGEFAQAGLSTVIAISEYLGLDFDYLLSVH